MVAHTKKIRWAVWLGVAIILVTGATRSGAEPIIQEFPVPPTVSAPFALKTDAAGHVWFTEKIGKKLVMFDPESKSFAVHSLPASWEGVGPSRLALGLHGEVWFTLRRSAESEVTTNRLGRFNPGNESFESFPLAEGITPEALTVDGHGVVWFLNPDGNELGRMQPDGQGQERHGLTTANGNPREITVDGQGVVWFSLPNINRIGRFDPTGGKFAEFEIPTPFANPGALATDDKGGIWFVELTANRIARFSPEQSRFDEVEIPTMAGLPIAVATDAEGRIWFLEYRGNKVGLFDPVRATFREFDIPTFNVQPGDMALDRQRGRLWFSETGTETAQLGLLTIATALTATDQPQLKNPPPVDGHSHGGAGEMGEQVREQVREQAKVSGQKGHEQGISGQSILIILAALGVVVVIARWAYGRVIRGKVGS